MDASPRRVRRRRGNAPVSDDRLADAGSDSDDCAPNGSNEMVPLRIGDTPKVLAYYEGALKHFQQLNCRMVAKAFIKFIEPRKQVRHPYNGGKPPAGSAPAPPAILRRPSLSGGPRVLCTRSLTTCAKSVCSLSLMVARKCVY